jgi:DNA mismatch endonuclease, patch repair protein
VNSPDQLTAEQRGKVMAAVKSKDTTPEKLVRKMMHAQGFRFRLHRRDLPGVPDLAFPRYRVAVFVNGCFWHWHGCKRSRMPATNRSYWDRKIKSNVARDLENKKKLEALGWRRVDIWECEIDRGVELLKSVLSEPPSSHSLIVD